MHRNATAAADFLNLPSNARGGTGLQGGDLSTPRLSLRQIARDTSLTAISSGFVATLVGFTSTIALVFHAAQSLGATPAQVTSWVLALGWAWGWLRWARRRARAPILITWSTPGAAVIARAASGGVSLAEATGAFVLSGG